jgi:hyperosmotically inducible protein
MRNASRTNTTKVIAGLFSLILILISGNALPAAKMPQAQTNPAGNEAWLQNKVRHELVMIPWYSVFDNLEFQVEGDKVTLLGQVTQPVIKDEADRAVKKIEGVKEVDDQIEVLPLSPFDNQIRRAEFRAIYSYPALTIYANQHAPSIHIIVKGGDVTLEGVVRNEADKNLATLRARGVPNVFSVTNNLTVEKNG